MANYLEMNREELTAEKEKLNEKYKKFLAMNLKLNMARGKPLWENNLALLKGVLLRVQATEYFLNVRRLHSAKKPCVC